MHSQDIVRVATAPNPQVGQIWQQALEEEGIQSRVVGDYLEVGVGDVPGIRPEIWVHRDDLERARALLAAHEHPPLPPPEANPEPEDDIDAPEA